MQVTVSKAKASLIKVEAAAKVAKVEESQVKVKARIRDKAKICCISYRSQIKIKGRVSKVSKSGARSGC